MWFGIQTVDLLNHVPAFSSQEHWMYKNTCPHLPINCNFSLQKDTIILYMAHTHHSLNNQVLAMFPLSTTIPAMLHYPELQNWQLFSTIWYVIVFFVVCDRFPFLQCGTNLFLVHVMNNITHSSMERDKCAHSHWFLIAQTQKIGISQVATSEDYTCDQNGNLFVPPHPTPSTPPSLQLYNHHNQDEILIQSLLLRFWYQFSGSYFLFQSVLPKDNSSLDIHLYFLVCYIK